MSTFDVNEFVAHPTLRQFHTCRKSDLCEIAERYGIPVSSSFTKKELKTVLFDGLLGKGLFLLAAVETPRLVAGAMAAVSSGEGRSETGEP